MEDYRRAAKLFRNLVRTVFDKRRRTGADRHSSSIPAITENMFTRLRGRVDYGSRTRTFELVNTDTQVQSFGLVFQTNE